MIDPSTSATDPPICADGPVRHESVRIGPRALPGDLAWDALPGVAAPTLRLVGGADTEVLTLNRAAAARLAGPQRLEVVPGASHLFEEPGALEAVADAAADWFVRQLAVKETR